MAEIGFIGLGHMGAPMAKNLLKAGHHLVVFDVMQEAIDDLKGAGAKSVNSLRQFSGFTLDCVITMLPSSPHVESVYLTKDQLLDHLTAKTLVIDCSTISPEMSRRVATTGKERGIKVIDAPVSGGTAGATNATLTFMVGGEKDAFEKAKPYLQQMGKNIFYAGENGAGQVCKICNNMLLAICMIGTAEALQLGVANGLDVKVLSEIMQKSSGRNWSLDVYNPYPGVMDNVPAANQYHGGFMVDLMAKDLGLALEAALQTKSSVPFGALARNLYLLHSAKGNGVLDFSSIQQLFSH